ncbi:MAG: zf-HC2 domain-containing protein [Clostridiales bacterium]|nr:zf-HC2 domain-containing protein [Clostridiales bacterium]
MNCANVKKLLPLYIDDELERSQIKAIEEHLVKCDGCMSECEDLLKVAMLLRAVPEVPLPASFDMRLRASIAASKAGEPPASKAKASEAREPKAKSSKAPAKSTEAPASRKRKAAAEKSAGKAPASRTEKAAAAKGRWKMVSGLAAVFVIGIFSIIVFSNMDVFVPSFPSKANDLQESAPTDTEGLGLSGTDSHENDAMARDLYPVFDNLDDGAGAIDGEGDALAPEEEQGNDENQALPEAPPEAPPVADTAMGVSAAPAAEEKREASGYVDPPPYEDPGEPPDPVVVDSNRNVPEDRDAQMVDYYLKRLADGLSGFNYKVAKYEKASEGLWIFYVDIKYVDEPGGDETVSTYLYFGRDGELWRESEDW